MRLLGSGFALLAGLVIGQVAQAGFPGWQGLLVVEQEGRPYVVRTANIDGQAGDELIVVNYRSSRLDVYSWQGNKDRKEFEATHPNDLPMAPELKHSEIQLELIPRDLIAQDLDADGQPELIVLASSPTQILILHRQPSGKWSQQAKYDLLEGEVSSRRESLLLQKTAADQFRLLVSLGKGIQSLDLKTGARAQWLTPREEQGRNKWWLADLDGDSYDDLIEQTRESSDPIRWYRGSAEGKLAPAAVLHEKSVSDAEVIRTPESVEIALLSGSVRQLLRRYRLGSGEPSPFGVQHPLAVGEVSKTAWCGMRQGQQRALVTADRKRPRLLSYTLDDTGWSQEEAFPAVSQVEALASPVAQPGTLLIWNKDAADLLISRWESGRLTYPLPWNASQEAKDHQILALSTVGKTTWWVQRVGKHLDLFRWGPEAQQADTTRFENVGTNADEVLWIGGDRLLVKESHSRALKLVVRAGDKTTITSPSHLKKANLAQYKLIAVGNETRLGRFDEGVLQWIGDDLLSHEQVMLPQAQELADYVATGPSGGWALQSDSPYVHRMEVEPSGLCRATDRVKVAQATKLVDDPVLGMLLVDHDRLTRLSEGRPQELKLVQAIDQRVGQEGGIRETKFHRLACADIDGDGYDELLLFDEMEHRITALADQQGTFQPKISWPVFDDKIYPYSEDYEDLVHEPRNVLALDIDGDGQQDLALLTHDRLLLYLAKVEE